MKNLKIITGMFLAGLLFAFAPIKQDAPKKVTDAFHSKFPNAKQVRWDKENANEWEAEFKLNGKEYSANFLDDGTWKETEHKISTSELPKDLKMQIKQKFPGYKIEEPEISETDKGKMFELVLEKDEIIKEVVANSNGQILSQKKVTKADED
ncbi:PepSY-like domain-containing protein [Gaetbulibacter aestuarii]|uniref:PepSY-like domain-containing protein n=1 Tax=Gaetbulibacter aestuarii TaxID=1502358 RepID=A0ABW7N1A3_9FLAO